MRRTGGAVVCSVLAIAGVLLGFWWAPFAFGVAFGVIQPRARIALPVGAAIGLVGWLFPLAAMEARSGLGPAAESLAAILGFGHQAAIPVILTLLVGTLLGVTGAWLGSAGGSALSLQGEGRESLLISRNSASVSAEGDTPSSL
jgi:hypothetical protein